MILATRQPEVARMDCGSRLNALLVSIAVSRARDGISLSFDTSREGIARVHLTPNPYVSAVNNWLRIGYG